MKNNTIHQIECKDLCLSYEGKRVLEDVNFFVDRGDYLCILGENGSGKSTLIKALLSLKRPTRGEIIFHKDTKKGHMGYLPQQTNIQRDFPASALEVVLSGCLVRGGFKPFFTRADKALAAANMEKMGISDIAGACYRELSGGQQQRVLLARALCASENMIILDEPISGLDPLAAKDMYRLIADLNEKESMTVIMVSHDVSALSYATKVLHLDGGVKFFGSALEYENSPLHRRWE